MAKTYTTVQGDMWDAIAHRILGDAAYTDQLMQLNRQHLEHYIFPAGIVLQLPESAEGVSQVLPPWKQVAG